MRANRWHPAGRGRLAARECLCDAKYQSAGAYHWRQLSPPDVLHPLRIRDYNAVLAARYEEVLRLVGDCSGKWVLDVGCGDGALSHLIARRGGYVYGLDPSHRGVELATCQTEGHTYNRRPCFYVGSAYSLGHGEGTFDCVLMADVIEHLREPRRALLEARRVLKPEGRLIVSTPQGRPGGKLAERHEQEFSALELGLLLGECFGRVGVQCSQRLELLKLYEQRVFGRRLPKVVVNALSVIGLNPFTLGSSGHRRISFSHRSPSIDQMSSSCGRYGQLIAWASWGESE